MESQQAQRSTDFHYRLTSVRISPSSLLVWTNSEPGFEKILIGQPLMLKRRSACMKEAGCIICKWGLDVDGSGHQVRENDPRCLPCCPLLYFTSDRERPKEIKHDKRERGGGLQAFKRKITHHLIVFLFNSIAADGFKQKCGTDLYSWKMWMLLKGQLGPPGGGCLSTIKWLKSFSLDTFTKSESHHRHCSRFATPTPSVVLCRGVYSRKSDCLVLPKM